MNASRSLVLALAFSLSTAGCVATFEVHDRLISGDNVPRTTTRQAAFYTLLPFLVAFDVVTAPAQFVYVITHLKCSSNTPE